MMYNDHFSNKKNIYNLFILHFIKYLIKSPLQH